MSKRKHFLFTCGAFENRTGLVACYNTFSLEMPTAEDPAPELVDSFCDCFIVSNTTNCSLQEVKDTETSCLTVFLAHTYSTLLNKGVFSDLKKSVIDSCKRKYSSLHGLTVWCLF